MGSGGYAVGSSDDGRKTLLEWTATGWVALADFGPITDTVGIVWRPRLDEPMQVGDAVLAIGFLEGELPWGDIYGGFPRSDCESDCRRRAPKATWDATAQRLHLVHPFDKNPIASLTIDVEGDTATFVDVGTGFAAYEQVGDETTDPVDRDVVTDVRTWKSEDAIEWTEASTPPLPYPWVGGVILSSRPGTIVAEGFSDDRTAVSHRLQVWESSDGLVWRERPPSPLPSHVPVAGMEFGYATVERFEDVPSSGRWRWRYWVLGDGDTWLEVVTPPAQPIKVGDGAYAWNQESGSVMYWGYGDATNDHLWVGRFES